MQNHHASMLTLKLAEGKTLSLLVRRQIEARLEHNCVKHASKDRAVGMKDLVSRILMVGNWKNHILSTQDSVSKIGQFTPQNQLMS